MSNSLLDGLQFVTAATAGNVNNGSLAVTELDTQAYGGHDWVAFVVLTGTPADTAAISAFTMKGSNTSSGAATGTTVVSHAAIAAHATNNDDKAIVLQYDLSKGGGYRYLDIVDFTETATANFAVAAAFWVLGKGRVSPVPSQFNNYIAGSPASS